MKVSDILAWEVVPPSKHKYVYMLAGAIVGGIVYPLTLSWGVAIFYDVTTALACWTVPRTLRLLIRLLIPD